MIVGWLLHNRLTLSAANVLRLQIAQRFPEVYDGVLAGAPAADWINLMSWEAHVRNLVEPVNGSSWIPGPTWGVIHQGELASVSRENAVD